MPTAKSDAFVLKFKSDSLLTVSRERFDAITERLGLNQTNTIHLALSLPQLNLSIIIAC